jgi:uncharacterized damage-inducible protein DinB
VNRADAVTFVDYILWVRDRIVDAAARLSDEQFVQSETVTNRDLRATLVHELDVEWSWRVRLMTGDFPDGEDLDPNTYTNLQAVRDHWQRDESELRAWVGGLDDTDLAAPPPGDTSGLPLSFFVMHLVTHAVQQFSEAAVLLTRAGHSPGDIGFLEFAAGRPTTSG